MIQYFFMDNKSKALKLKKSDARLDPKFTFTNFCFKFVMSTDSLADVFLFPDGTLEDLVI